MHLAAWFGLTNVLSALTARFDVDSADSEQKQTPLILAARRGHVKTVNELIKPGASINKCDAQGHDAIYEAAAEQHDEVMKVLLINDAIDLNRKYICDFNRTILMIAIGFNHLTTVELLLEKDVDASHHDVFGLTALSMACSVGSVDIVKRLVTSTSVEVNDTASAGRTALSIVAAKTPPLCRDVETELTHILLDMGASPDHRDNRGKTPAMLAVSKGKKHILEVIIAKTQVIDAVDFEGRTLLHEAAGTHKKDMVKYLVTKGIGINVRDSHDRTPLHEAARFGFRTILRELISLKAERSLRDKWGRTPFEVARQNGHVSKNIALLLSVDFENGLGSVFDPKIELLPLWSIVKLGDEELLARRIKSLDERQAILTAAPDPDTGNTLIHSAISCGNVNILKRLLEAAAPEDRQTLINATNDNGRTSLHDAVCSRKLDFVTTLLLYKPCLDGKDKDKLTPLLIDYFENLIPGNSGACGIALIAAGAAIDSEALIKPYFFAAIRSGNYDAVKILIGKKKTLVQAKSEDGQTPRQVAKPNGHSDILQLL